MSRIMTGLAAAALVTLIAPAPANPLTHDKLAYMTFTAPVQIPGATLGAGTYRFWLTNPDGSRNVLQVLSGDGAIVYAMFHTIPDFRTVLTEEPAVTFRETPAGVPPAVKTLFYGGEYHGYEFVYPKGGPNTVAELFPQPGVTYAAIPPTSALAPVAEAAIEPAPEPVVEEHAEAALPEPAVAAAPAPEAEQLPHTATSLPTIALVGVSLLVLGVAFGLVRRYIN